MVVLMGTTSPIDKIAYAIVFFGILLIFIASIGHLIVRLQTEGR